MAGVVMIRQPASSVRGDRVPGTEEAEGEGGATDVFLTMPGAVDTLHLAQ